MGDRVVEARASALLSVSAAGVAALVCAAAPVRAADLPATAPMFVKGDINDPGHHMEHDDHGGIPAGVMGAGMISAGKFMFSYNPMYMHMEGNYIGTSRVSADTVKSTPSPTMPGHYLVVPTSMDMQAHMLGGMYGVTDWLNVMVMRSYQIKSMNMTTFAMMDSSFLGTSRGSTEGFGDTSVGLLWRLWQDPVNHVHFNLGFSAPTGSTTEQITMLAPHNAPMTMRASYGMQLGTGTVDFMPGLTYTGHLGHWVWGAQWRSRFALDDNDQGYHYGDQHEFTGWAGYTWLPGVTTTARLAGTIQSQIHGADPVIGQMIMMEGANPALYGGKRVELLGGLEIAGARFGLPGVNVALEGGGPIYQDLNGPQLGESWRLSGALRVGF